MPRDAWYGAAHVDELANGPVATRILDVPVVLFAGKAGPVALVDRCPHRLAALSRGCVIDGAIACPYHGWRFDSDGRCIHIPGLVAGEADKAPRRATRLACRVQDGIAWVCVEGQGRGAPPRALLADVAGAHTMRWRSSVRCDPVDALENFLDATHTHHVHPGLVRREGARKPVGVQVRGLPGGVEAIYQESDQSGAIARWFGADIVESYGRYHWPAVAQLGFRDGRGLEKLVITACFVPGTDSVEVVSVIAGRPPRWVPGWLAGALIAPFLRRTIAQDKAILEHVAEQRRGAPEVSLAMSPLDLLRPHIERLLDDPARITPASPRQLVVEL